MTDSAAPTFPVSDAQRDPSGALTFPPAKCCIYCGYSRSGSSLTREHIVPLGLFGNLILPNASCKHCAKATSQFELFVLREMFGRHRAKFQFPSRRRKKKPKTKAYVYTIEENVEGEEVQLCVDQFPFHSYGLPVLGLPGLTVQTPIEELCKNDRLELCVGQHDLQTMLEATGSRTKPVGSRLSKYHPKHFARFLAKIAHGYACATLGQETFTPLLNDFIIKGTGLARQYVGGETHKSPTRPTVFEIQLGHIMGTDGKRFLSARIRLLAYMGTPTYIVVIGTDFPHDVTALDLPLSHMRKVSLTVKGQDGATLFSTGS